ncbi:zinc finger protein 888-like, partial [Papilio machaon]|uniref:zinc finger protein 888-like n=1 Tax=Papilio machaon TaxID=76193 RepID=UPI001E662F2B
MPRRASMAESIGYDFPSDKIPIPGYQKSPIVLLNRLKVNHLLNNVRVKYNKNGSVVTYSTDVAQHRILRKILLDCTVDLVKIDSMNVDSLTKEDETQNDAKNLLVIDTVKNRRIRPRIYKNLEKSSTPKQRKNQTRKNKTRKNKTSKNKRKQHKCRECNKIFKNLNCFNIHCRFKHVSGNYHCAHCSKKYKRQKFFERHIKLHCNICHKLQQNEHQLFEHTAICRNSEQVDNQTVLANKYTCELCTDQFDTNCAITYHKAMIHSDNPPTIKDLYYIRFLGSTKVYVCYFCKETSVNKDYLESHVTVLRNMSKKNVNYPCDQCMDSFDVEDDLLQHKTLHTITDSNMEVAQYEHKRSSLDIIDSNPMLLQIENINDFKTETDNAETETNLE